MRYGYFDRISVFLAEHFADLHSLFPQKKTEVMENHLNRRMPCTQLSLITTGKRFYEKNCNFGNEGLKLLRFFVLIIYVFFGVCV